MTIIGVECRNCGSSHEFIDNRADEAIADMYKAIDERDALSARLAGTQDLYVQACEQRDDALALLTKVSLRKSCEGTQPYICHGLATARARLAEAERDAARYRYMRGNASFRDRNGPGLYWYLPRFLPGGSAEQLDASIDASITADSADEVQK